MPNGVGSLIGQQLLGFADATRHGSVSNFETRFVVGLQLLVFVDETRHGPVSNFETGPLVMAFLHETFVKGIDLL